MEFVKYSDLNKKENYKKKFYTGIPITLEERELENPKPVDKPKVTSSLLEDSEEVIDKEVVAVQQRLDITIYLYRYKRSYRLAILKEGDLVPDESTLPVLSYKRLNRKLKKLSKSFKCDTIVFL